LGAGPIDVLNRATPLALVGDFTNVSGERQITATDAAVGRFITDSALPTTNTTLSDNPLPTWTAAGTVTLSTWVPSDNDYVTLPDGTNAPVNFEFKVTGGFVAKAPFPRAVVDISAAADDTARAAAITAAINSKNYLVQPNPLNLVATAALGVVSITNERQGTAGNVAITKSIVDAANFTVAGMTGGVATSVVLVPSTAGFLPEGFIQIDSEIMGYTSITANVSFNGVTRAMRNTLVASHLVAAATTQIDQYAGYYISMLSGSGGTVTQRRQIGTQSLAGVLSVLDKFSPVPVVGAFFRIEKPSVNINLTSSCSLFIGAERVGYEGVTFNFASFLAQTSFLFNENFFEGVWMIGAAPGNRGFFFYNGATVFSGSPAAADAFAAAGVNNPFSASRLGGIYFKNMTIGSGAAGQFTGSMVMHGVVVDLTEAQFNPTRIFGDRLEMTLGRGTTSNLQFDTSANPAICMWTRSLGNPMIIVEQNAVLRRLTGALQMDNASSTAVFNRGGQIRELGSNNPITLTGKNNALVGQQTIYGGLTRVTGSGVNLRGALGEVKSGRAATSITWSALRALFPNSQDGIAGNIYQANRIAYLQPTKVTFTGLALASSFDITSGPLGGQPPALAIAALRVTAGAAAAVGSYAVTDVGGTPLSPAAGTVVGLATLSNDGKTITFPGGSDVTALVLEYIPADLYRYDAAQIVNNSV
jgi:hypothetical protein